MTALRSREIGRVVHSMGYGPVVVNAPIFRKASPVLRASKSLFLGVWRPRPQKCRLTGSRSSLELFAGAAPDLFKWEMGLAENQEDANRSTLHNCGDVGGVGCGFGRSSGTDPGKLHQAGWRGGRYVPQIIVLMNGAAALDPGIGERAATFRQVCGNREVGPPRGSLRKQSGIRLLQAGVVSSRRFRWMQNRSVA